MVTMAFEPPTNKQHWNSIDNKWPLDCMSVRSFVCFAGTLASSCKKLFKAYVSMNACIIDSAQLSSARTVCTNVTPLQSCSNFMILFRMRTLAMRNVIVNKNKKKINKKEKHTIRTRLNICTRAMKKFNTLYSYKIINFSFSVFFFLFF